MPPPDKTFTQAQIDVIVQERVAKLKTELATLQKDVDDRDLVIEAAHDRVAELEQQHASALSERDALRADLATASASHTEQLAELEQQRAEVVSAHRREKAERTLASALAAARVAPVAERFAVAELLRVAEVEQDGAGQVVAVQYAGQRYADDQLGYQKSQLRPAGNDSHGDGQNCESDA